jgi:hypothetical protein
VKICTHGWEKLWPDVFTSPSGTYQVRDPDGVLKIVTRPIQQIGPPTINQSPLFRTIVCAIAATALVTGLYYHIDICISLVLISAAYKAILSNHCVTSNCGQTIKYYSLALVSSTTPRTMIRGYIADSLNRPL